MSKEEQSSEEGQREGTGPREPREAVVRDTGQESQARPGFLAPQSWAFPGDSQHPYAPPHIHGPQANPDLLELA